MFYGEWAMFTSTNGLGIIHSEKRQSWRKAARREVKRQIWETANITFYKALSSSPPFSHFVVRYR